MPNNKIIPISKGEYPELESVEEGQKIPFNGEVTVTKDEDGNGQIMIESMEFQVENSATKTLKQMTKQEDTDKSSDTVEDSKSGSF